MNVREIPREEWSRFFDSFSRMHRGWLITLEVVDPRTGSGVEARLLPLDGVVADVRHGGDDITVLIGSDADCHVGHSIARPTRVCVLETAEGAHDTLRIESASGDEIMLWFRSAVPPQMVDGLVTI